MHLGCDSPKPEIPIKIVRYATSPEPLLTANMRRLAPVRSRNVKRTGGSGGIVLKKSVGGFSSRFCMQVGIKTSHDYNALYVTLSDQNAG